jgi:hypothetical protein
LYAATSSTNAAVRRVRGKLWKRMYHAKLGLFGPGGFRRNHGPAMKNPNQRRRADKTTTIRDGAMRRS